MNLGKSKILFGLIICLVLFTVSISYAAEYIVPRKPASVDVADIDLDGDLDIVLGHHYVNDWSGISILINDGRGVFTLVDSLYYGGSHSSLYVLDLDDNNSYDIITEYYDTLDNNCLGIVFDFEDSLYENHFSLKKGAGYLNVGDIDSDNDIDVIFYSNPYFFWGYVKNEGNGEFSEPVYYDLDYPPQGIAIGDLNGDSRQDILIGGQMDSWLNFESGLQYYSITDTINVSGVEISDIDNDGDNDIIASKWYMPGTPKKLVIYTNDGVGNFEQTYTRWIDEALAKIFVSDLNNDNYPDIIYNVSYSYPNSDEEIFNTYILFNNQDGTFQDPVNYYTGICSHVSHSADLDGNGWDDIITLNYDFYKLTSLQATIHILFNDSTGNFVEESQTSIDNGQFTIDNYELEQNYPNPFNNITSISYNIKELSHIKLVIYNSKGECINTLVNKKQDRGKHKINFNAYNLNSGIYFYRLKVDGVVKETRKMLYLK